MDSLREDDMNQLSLLTKQLQKMRREEKLGVKKQASQKMNRASTTERPPTAGVNSSIRKIQQQHKVRSNKLRP